MSHIPYTICRHGTYYYNRRVPKHAVDLYGYFIRYGLSSDPVVATTYAKRLSEVLETSWQSKLTHVHYVTGKSIQFSYHQLVTFTQHINGSL